MSESGIVQRNDMYLIWEQKHFNKISPYKEFIFDMLIHLDILSEQRRYDTYTGSRLPVENFFVPCMLTQRNDTSFMTHECTPEKAISLAFVFKGTIIPPALPNRLISACLSMWTVKTYEGKRLLFSGFIGLSFDKAHSIVTNEECEVDCKGLQEDALSQIPSDIELQRLASSCDDTIIRELAIHLGITLKEWEKLKCDYEFVGIVKYRILVSWREKYSGRFSDIAKALQDMDMTTHTLCQVKRIRKVLCGISEEYMDLIPTDEILDKLAQVVGVVYFQLGIELGLPITSIDIIRYNNGRDLVGQCKDILFQWREDQRVRPTIRVLVQALVNVDRGAKCLEEIIKTVGVKIVEHVEENKDGKIQTFLKKLNPFQKKIRIDSQKV
ncbi:Hypothetical predicted protein [Mytilus galloprovincialis]|uniref:Death domain-containing protein n=1 Tax=Mytilus galloprovincialis TaxID=29158 RepID=A0A8B6C768_MYTGA|nr:Hypothetical predicted protein [Mytilus galloprovincialis]